jgi:hypothetical protein
MLDRLRPGEKSSIESRRIVKFRHNLFAFVQYAEDRVAGLTARRLPDQFENFFQAADLSFGFITMRLKGVSQLAGVGGFRQLGKGLQNLFFGKKMSLRIS